MLQSPMKPVMGLFFFFLFFLLTFFDDLVMCAKEEDFSEELLLRPLPDGKVLAHFQFTHRLHPPVDNIGKKSNKNNERHHHRLFPKSIYQLIRKFRIQGMELSFTQGRWNYDQWGGVDPITRLNAKPSGVELWAEFAVPEEDVDITWGNLTHALSGLFCASLNFLESPLMTADPVRAFKRKKKEVLSPSSCGSIPHQTWADADVNARYTDGNPKRVRYGSLPREAVCTENLTPWLKLLPCRDKAGFATLLDRPTIYKGWYHSLRLHVVSTGFGGLVEEEHQGGTLLQQTLTLVLQPSMEDSFPWDQTGASLQPSWSLSSLFGRDLSSRGCPLSKSSSVYMEFEGSLMEKLKQHSVGESLPEKNGVCTERPGEGLGSCLTAQQKPEILSDLKSNSVFSINGMPDDVLLEIGNDEKASSSILLAFVITDHENVYTGDIGLTWKIPFSWTPSRVPFRATRFLVGNGNAKGAIALVLKSNQLKADQEVVIESVPLSTKNVVLFQVVPWYIRSYLHTLKIFIDMKPVLSRKIISWMHVVPSEDRRSPGVMEMELMIPSNATVVTLIIEFDKGFLRIDEHPPDANRGFDLPAAHLDFSYQRSGRTYYQLGVSKNAHVILDSPLLQEFQKERSVQTYTEVLLVPLATPDFSMPYNVITLTCTVLALYFGSLLNILRRRIGEEERLMDRKEVYQASRVDQLLSKILRRKPGTSPSRLLKLIKFAIVIVIAVGVNYLLDKS